MSSHENAVAIARIEATLTELAANIKQLTKSYNVLNDSHVELELSYMRMETEWKTAKGLLSWIAGGSLLTFVVSAVTLAKAMGWF